MFAKLLLAIAALAHQGGHGPAIHGTGPSGGRLAAVISAKDAELGQQAKAQAVAEWTREGRELVVRLWNMDRSKPLAASGDLTWILFPKEGKPQVIRRTLKNGRSRMQLSEGVEQHRGAELVITQIAGLEGKHVLSFQW